MIENLSTGNGTGGSGFGCGDMPSFGSGFYEGCGGGDSNYQLRTAETNQGFGYGSVRLLLQIDNGLGCALTNVMARAETP